MRHVSRLLWTRLSFCLVGLWGALSGGCAATRSVRPMGKGHFAAGASVGGPLFNNLSVPVVAPLVSVFGRLGLTTRTDVDLGIMLPTGRVAGVDVGASHLLLRPKHKLPYVMLGGRAMMFGNARSWRQQRDDATATDLGFDAEIFEELFVNMSYDVTQACYAFVGADLFAQAQRNSWRPSLMGGFVWRSQNGLSLQAQLNWLAVHRATDALSLRYVSIASLGSVGVQLALSYDFARLRRPAPR